MTTPDDPPPRFVPGRGRRLPAAEPEDGVATPLGRLASYLIAGLVVILGYQTVDWLMHGWWRPVTIDRIVGTPDVGSPLGQSVIEYLFLADLWKIIAIGLVPELWLVDAGLRFRQRRRAGKRT